MLRYFTRKVISGVLSAWPKNSTEGQGLDNDLEAIGVSVTMRNRYSLLKKMVSVARNNGIVDIPSGEDVKATSASIKAAQARKSREPAQVWQSLQERSPQGNRQSQLYTYQQLMYQHQQRVKERSAFAV